MLIFNQGDKFELRRSARPRWNELAGFVEVLSIDRVPDSEMEFVPTSIRGNSDAVAGVITFIVYSETTNAKPKKARLIRSRVSKEYADKYCGGISEYEWFIPTKRSYYPISSEKGRL